MKRLIFVAIALAMLRPGGGAEAGDTYSIGNLTVVSPWARASAGPAKAGAAYLTITNGGKADDRLIGVAAESVAGMAMFHTTIKDGDVMKMRHVDGIAVKAGETVTLRPGGIHVMLMGLKAPLTEGQRFPLMLTFDKAGAVTVEVEVESVAAGAGHGKHHP